MRIVLSAFRRIPAKKENQLVYIFLDQAVY